MRRRSTMTDSDRSIPAAQVRNELSDVAGTAVQAAAIHGDVTINSPQHRTVVPQQLPGVNRNFVGRTVDLATLSTFIDQSGGDDHGTRIVLIDGIAGVGKT